MIAIIAGFIILYILLISPEDREALLGINDTADVSQGEVIDDNVLLKESPGTVYSARQTEFEHQINSFNLYTRSEDAIIKSVDTAYVSASRSSEATKKIIFIVDSPENAKNIVLSFNVADHRGRIIILLNDEEVFNGEVSGFQQVKLDDLEEENLIEIRASKLGWLSFTKNFYELKDIKISGTITDVSSREAINSFYLSEEEASGIKSAYLIYIVECRGVTGKMSVYLNEELIESKVPDCGSPVKITIDPELLAAGKNVIGFLGEKGAYSVYQVAIKTQLKEPIYPTYYFEVSREQLEKVRSGELDSELKMEFVDDGSVKRAELNINGHKAVVDTTDDVYTRNLDSWVEEGSNYVKIVPSRTLQIPELRIELV